MLTKSAIHELMAAAEDRLSSAARLYLVGESSLTYIIPLPHGHERPAHRRAPARVPGVQPPTVRLPAIPASRWPGMLQTI